MFKICQFKKQFFLKGDRHNKWNLKKDIVNKNAINPPKGHPLVAMDVVCPLKHPQDFQLLWSNPSFMSFGYYSLEFVEEYIPII